MEKSPYISGKDSVVEDTARMIADSQKVIRRAKASIIESRETTKQTQRISRESMAALRQGWRPE
ncbi:MAG: hypothetical protein ABIT76_04005 [Chthoniobacterales bacterium]